MGLIAQEVEKVFPQWVKINSAGYKDLTVSGFEGLTAEAIRELKAENNALKARIEALEAKLNARQ
jgi:BMFP domain-containing protein YqiC